MFCRDDACERQTSVMAAIFLILVSLLAAGEALAAAAKTAAEIALYRGPDREKRLLEGAKKEGRLMIYVSNVLITGIIRQEFSKKYPFLKVEVWHADSKQLLKRTLEEYSLARYEVDAVDDTDPAIRVLVKEGVLQEYFNPEEPYYPEEVKQPGATGVYYLGDWESHNSLGFNTKIIPPAEAPKTYQDLLDLKWKGKMSIAGTATAVRWVGNVLNVQGMEYLQRLSKLNVKLHNISAGALGNLLISGEVPLSPTITDYTVAVAKKKGAPVEWRPLEPVVTNVGFSGIAAKAPNPHAAMLFLDFIHSREGQKLVMREQSSPRQDTGGEDVKYKKAYMGREYTIEEYEKKFDEWDNLMKRLFVLQR